MVQGQGVTRQRPASTRQGSPPLPARRGQPLAVCRVAPPGSLARGAGASRRVPGSPPPRRRSVGDDATTRVAFDPWGAPHVAPGPPTLAGVPGSTKVSRIARMSVHHPSGQTHSGRCAAPRCPRSISRSRCARGMSRGALPAPPSHTRGLTILATPSRRCHPHAPRAAHGLARGPGPAVVRRGCPARRAPVARSGPTQQRLSARPTRTPPRALTGQPWASKGITITTVSAEVRRRSQPVPCARGRFGDIRGRGTTAPAAHRSRDAPAMSPLGTAVPVGQRTRRGVHDAPPRCVWKHGSSKYVWTPFA